MTKQTDKKLKEKENKMLIEEFEKKQLENKKQLIINNETVKDFTINLKDALKDEGISITIEQTKQVLAKMCNKSSYALLEKQLETNQKNKISSITEEQALEYFHMVKHCSKHQDENYLFGVDNELLSKIFVKFFTGNSINPIPENFSFKLKFVPIDLKFISNSFFEDKKGEQLTTMNDVSYYNLTSFIKDNHIETFNHLKEIKNLDWNKSTVLIVLEFKPINIFNGKTVTQEFFCLFFLAQKPNGKISFVSIQNHANKTEEPLDKFGEGSFFTILNYASDDTLDEIENNVIELMAKLFAPLEKDKNTNENNDNKKTS